jgi:CRP-like cAMP-binding protein
MALRYNLDKGTFPLRKPSQPELEYLRKTEIFRGLTDQVLTTILNFSRQRTYRKDEFVFMQGAPARRFYVVKSGQIKLYQTTADGGRVTLRYVGPGEAFGVIVVLRETEYPVSAQAAEDCVLLGWSDQNLKDIMLQHPKVAIHAISILSDFILGFMDRIQGLSTRRVDQRVAKALLRFAETTGQYSEQIMTIGMKLTRQDIAEITGTTLYTVSRTLSAWESKGWIDCSNSFIRIKQSEKLEELAHD